ncbi:hypothetical protein F3Y22_tig00111213pilonHSYRG00478 [Hibiscus syriacus]|uniref:Uncharacterized protein n=1 Tax=Hibiscus syriacus TaxID=106335 RepID=A0A6A2YVZ3_HIBSY|nr:hypothetical protein F3Y22_tig00111213pilonHSYRG00478 [Hibiscus syriacus]
MEIMNLKPSFARKLNQHGLSPIHIAVKKGHKEMVLLFIEINKDLVRVKGKKGETPFITSNCTSLHIAVKNKRFDVFEILIRMLRKKDYYREVKNQKDEDGNTVLHIAAGDNLHPLYTYIFFGKVLKLLLECKADKNVANQDGLIALDLAQKHNNKECINILRSCFCPRVSDFHYKLKKQIVDYMIMASSLFSYDTDNISGDDRNALLLILGLLLTATYQATLSPPMAVLPIKPPGYPPMPSEFMTQSKWGYQSCINLSFSYTVRIPSNMLRPIHISDCSTPVNIQGHHDIFDIVHRIGSAHVRCSPSSETRCFDRRVLFVTCSSVCS